jgi:hypothetical protein
MARKNKLCNSFMALGLDPDEDKKVKEALIKIDKSGKQVARTLFREWLKNPK